MNQAQMQAVIDKYYPAETFREQVLKKTPRLEEYEGRPEYAAYFRPPQVVLKKDRTDEMGQRMSLTIAHPVMGFILSMKFKYVEKCCAMCFLYDFCDGNVLSVEDLKILIDGFLATAKNDGWVYFTSNRLIVNMVECNGDYINPLKGIAPRDNPTRMMQNPRIHDYFTTNAAKVNTMLMGNANGGNIIHHMEVVFGRNYFKVQ